jgi:hypothetical protein
MMSNDQLGSPEHPELSEEENELQRGTDPDTVVGTDPVAPATPDPDPDWQPDPGRADEWRRIANEIGRERRPRREDVYPYLLIRATASGDRGKRPTWPPVPCWESPDILLLDASYTGEFDPARLVVSPVAGRSYRVFVRIWNLGLFPATGVHVKAWAINPGFFGTGNQNDPYYQQNIIGGRWVELADRTRPSCTALVELDATWDIRPDEFGHHCLLAEVGCPMDPASGLLLSNNDRHVGQRNLEVLLGSADAKELFGQLAGLVPEDFTLELTHAGPAALGTLQALGGGVLLDQEGRPHEIVLPELEEVQFGVSTGTAVHLLTALRTRGRTLVARSDRLAEVSGIQPGAPGRGRVHPFDRPGGTRRLIERLGPDSWERIGTVTDQPLADALLDGLARLLDVDGFEAGRLASRLGGPDRAQHPLRLTLTDADGGLIGGYTVVLG